MGKTKLEQTADNILDFILEVNDGWHDEDLNYEALCCPETVMELMLEEGEYKNSLVCPVSEIKMAFKQACHRYQGILMRRMWDQVELAEF